ncbi:hypothetical protein HDV00_011414 [Rhizophlyctis rosea]|nr:hypothetical protein HDV00_011414 [Rhizophlyctis rosea]
MNIFPARRLSRQIADEQAQLEGVNKLLAKEKYWEKQYDEQLQALKEVQDNISTGAQDISGAVALSAEVEAEPKVIQSQNDDDASNQSLLMVKAPTPSPTPAEPADGADLGLRAPPPSTTTLSQLPPVFDPSLIGATAAHLTRSDQFAGPTTQAPLPTAATLHNPSSIPATVRPGAVRAAVIKDIFHPRSSTPKNTITTSTPNLHIQAHSAVDLTLPPPSPKKHHSLKSFNAPSQSIATAPASTTPPVTPTPTGTSIPELESTLKNLKITTALAKQTLRNSQALNWERRKSIVEIGESLSRLSNPDLSSASTPNNQGSSVSLVEDALHGESDKGRHLEDQHRMAVRDEILESEGGLVGPLQFRDGVLDRAEGVPGTVRDWNEAAEVREGRA